MDRRGTREVVNEFILQTESDSSTFSSLYDRLVASHIQCDMYSGYLPPDVSSQSTQS